MQYSSPRPRENSLSPVLPALADGTARILARKLSHFGTRRRFRRRGQRSARAWAGAMAAAARAGRKPPNTQKSMAAPKPAAGIHNGKSK